jgi:putative transposase
VTKFAFVSAERDNHAVVTLCRVIGVSVSGFYAWLHAIPVIQDRAEAEVDLCGHISWIFAARRRFMARRGSMPNSAGRPAAR